jgi:hypothetical protein
MSEPVAFRIEVVAATADMDVVRTLFREYQQELGVDLSFQDFGAELAGLPARTRRRADACCSPAAPERGRLRRAAHRSPAATAR